MSDDLGAQPEQGQDAQAQDTPYAQYLERFPEEQRALASEVFKEWDGNVTKRFQDASQFRQQMEPFAEVVQGWDPDAARWARQMHEAAVNTPEAIRDWYEGYAKEHGLTPQEAADLEAEAFEDPELGKVLESQLAPLRQQIEAITAQYERQQQEARFEEARTMIEGQMSAEKERLGDAFNKEAIEGFAGKYIETDPANAITRAARDWEQIYNQIQAGALQQKVDTDRPAAEAGGVPVGSREPIKTLAQAREAALEVMRGANAA